MENRTEGMDASPYLNEENLDPKWVEEVIKTGALVADREV
jgi:hydroxyversicolorone monooxygenase